MSNGANEEVTLKSRLAEIRLHYFDSVNADSQR